jgi:catechol 2,3-dioxygenase-like lactoylglutathione lyase family enzyme
MPDTAVTHVRYVALGVPDYAQQVDFYGGVWGLKRVDHDSDVTFFAAEGSPEQYIFRIRKSPERRVDVLGLAVDDAAAVDALAARLGGEGVRLVQEPGPLDTPGGGYGFRFFDPDGRVVEVSAEVAPRQFRVLEPREAIPQKLSHVVFYGENPGATVAFYREKLGFLLSGWLGDWFSFLRSSRQPDFHTLAFVKGTPSYFHSSFELRGYDEYMRGCGRALQAGVPLLSGLGKHTPADSAFAYFMDPNGLTCEFSPPQEQILDAGCWKAPLWRQGEAPGDVWGTARSQNLPEEIPPGNRPGPLDPGLWIAPPI